MGESVLYRDLYNQNQQDRIRGTIKSFRAKIVAITACLVLTLAATLLVNDVGLTSLTEDDGLCDIDIAGWFIAYTIAVGIKLIMTSSRYYSYKKNRIENIPLYLTDLIGMNLLMTAIFIKANMMYFSDNNKCFNTTDTMMRRFYYVFCALTLLGYF